MWTIIKLPGRFPRLLAVLSLAVPLLAAPRPAGRVLLFSLDGMGYQRWTDDPAAAELTALRTIARSGVTARGVIPHFPSTTANSHAALWTGAYGDVNGISANSNPMAPRAEHTFLDRAIGFRAESLTAEPIWAAAARQGIKAVAYQATQAYPFLPINTAPGSSVPPIVINGYQTKMVAAGVLLGPPDVTAEDCGAWQPAVKSTHCFAWSAGTYKLHAAALRDSLVVAADPAGNRVIVTAAPEEVEPPRRRPLARHFSAGLFLTPELVVHFRLFSLSPGASSFALFQTPIHELGYYNGSSSAAAELQAMLKATGAFVGNGPTSLLRQGRLGKMIVDGGDGTAERRCMEGIEFVVRQNVRQTVWLWKRYSPRFMTGYLNYPDEVDHLLLGLTHPATPGVPPDLRERYRAVRSWGYVILNRAMDVFIKLPSRGDHIIFASDHGMAPVWKQVRVDEVLNEPGLAGKASHVYNFLVLNTKDWKDGAIPEAEREAWIDRAQATLARIEDPDTGEPVFRDFARPSRNGAKFGIGGPSGGDLYWDLAPGYYFSRAKEGPIISAMRVPAGNHGYLPTRPDMLAICIAKGPRMRPGTQWPTLHSIDIAPLVADLLGIKPPLQARGHSPLD